MIKDKIYFGIAVALALVTLPVWTVPLSLYILISSSINCYKELSN